MNERSLDLNFILHEETGNLRASAALYNKTYNDSLCPSTTLANPANTARTTIAFNSLSRKTPRPFRDDIPRSLSKTYINPMLKKNLSTSVPQKDINPVEGTAQSPVAFTNPAAQDANNHLPVNETFPTTNDTLATNFTIQTNSTLHSITPTTPKIPESSAICNAPHLDNTVAPASGHSITSRYPSSIRNPYTSKDTLVRPNTNNNNLSSGSAPKINTHSRKIYTSPFLETSQKPSKDSLTLNPELEPLRLLILSQHEAFTQHIIDLSETSLFATKIIEKKNDSFKLLKYKKKIPRSLRIKCTLSTSPEFMTNNEFITLKEELDDVVAAFIDKGTNIMTKWAQRNIFLLKRERCLNTFRKALQILDGLIHFHKAVIGTPSWPSVPPNNITLFLIKLYLSNEFLDINSLLKFFDLPSDKISLICAQLLTNKNSEEVIITHLNSLLLTDINMQEDLQHDFIYETLLQFDQIIKITTIDTLSHYQNKTRHIDTGDSLKAKMAAFETTDATARAMHAIAKATKNLYNLENLNLQTQLRLTNLEKATSHQEQITNKVRCCKLFKC